MPVLEAIATAAGKTEGVKEVTAEEAKETAKNAVENIKNSGDAVLSKLDDIKNMTPEQLSEKVNKALEENEAENAYGDGEADEKQEGLTDEEKAKIKEETGWSDEIIDNIDSMEQYEIYKNANLHEVEIDGKKCLVKDIDMDYVDPKTGLTNRELMEKGRAPIDAKTGEKIELHHMGQNKDGPFAELCENSEHGDGNHGTLHPKTDGSWRNESGANEKYNNERAGHWKARAQEA